MAACDPCAIPRARARHHGGYRSGGNPGAVQGHRARTAAAPGPRRVQPFRVPDGRSPPPGRRAASGSARHSRLRLPLETTGGRPTLPLVDFGIPAEPLGGVASRAVPQHDGTLLGGPDQRAPPVLRGLARGHGGGNEEASPLPRPIRRPGGALVGDLLRPLREDAGTGEDDPPQRGEGRRFPEGPEREGRGVPGRTRGRGHRVRGALPRRPPGPPDAGEDASATGTADFPCSNR